MSRPLLLDLFCGEGGAGQGYRSAGFEVVGVDTDARRLRRYPGETILADCLQLLADRGFVRAFDLVHASPPCQAYSITRHAHGKAHPELVGPVRELLQRHARSWVIENVPGAPLRNPVILCGSHFGLTGVDGDGTKLRLQRHRLFEASWDTPDPGPHPHDRKVPVGGVYGAGSSTREQAKVRRGGYTPSKSVREQLMGIDWMTLDGLSQAIPPAYSEWVGISWMEEKS